MTRTALKSSWFVAPLAVVTLAVGVHAADMKDPAGKRPRPQSPSSPFILRQQIDGEISKTDPKAGVVVVAIPSGKLRITSSALATSPLAKGDPVLVEVGLLPATSGGRAPLPSQTRGNPDPAIVRERFQAHVAAVNPTRGGLKLTIPAGAIDLWLPSTLLERFKKDDLIPVELALLPAPSGTHAERAGLAALLLSIFGGKK